MKDFINVTVVASCWVCICALVFGLCGLHAPFWLATVISIPVGFVLGLFIARVMLSLTFRLLRKEWDHSGPNLFESLLLPLAALLFLTLWLVPALTKASQKAKQKEQSSRAGQMPNTPLQPTPRK